MERHCWAAITGKLLHIIQCAATQLSCWKQQLYDWRILLAVLHPDSMWMYRFMSTYKFLENSGPFFVPFSFPPHCLGHALDRSAENSGIPWEMLWINRKSSDPSTAHLTLACTCVHTCTQSKTWVSWKQPTGDEDLVEVTLEYQND